MAFTTFSAGTGAVAAQVNANFSGTNNKLLLNYTSTAFDASRSTTGTTSNSYEPSAIAAADLTEKNYLIINATVNASVSLATDGTGSSALLIEEKYVGGSYSSIFTGTALSYTDRNAISLTQTFTYVYTLTANDKANGVQLKFTGSATGLTSPAGSASIANVQVTAFATR